MSVVISVSHAAEDFFLSNWAFNELMLRAMQHPDANADVRYRLEKAQALNGLLLENMPNATQRQVASILVETARDMAFELELPRDAPRDAVFATWLRELVTFLERAYGSRPTAPNGSQAGR